MKVIDDGHVYALANIDGPGEQALRFVKREGPRYPGNVGHHPGVTMQEVLRALIHRAEYVYTQIPCVETQIAIRSMETALVAMEQRHARVKGRHLHLESTVADFVHGQVCETCGHIACLEHA